MRPPGGRQPDAAGHRGMTGTRRGAALLAASSAGSGLLAYGVFAVVTRTLGPEAAAPVSVLWTWWGFAAAAVTFPIQHWATRSISAHGEASVRHALGRVTLIVLAVAAVAGAASWVGREALFHSTSAAFPTMVALLTLGSAIVGLNRGALAARCRYAMAICREATPPLRDVGAGHKVACVLEQGALEMAAR